MTALTQDELERAITLDDSGGIVVESYFEKEMAPDDLTLLESCVEDNIYDDGAHYENFVIDYAGVLRDYREALRMRKDET